MTSTFNMVVVSTGFSIFSLTCCPCAVFCFSLPSVRFLPRVVGLFIMSASEFHQLRHCSWAPSCLILHTFREVDTT
ncbi:hypothetical protein BJV78DRAFT_606699 [Lactifluus subvellereus]|nr:hypothetical protein BJV78DRAFT_606699 [Lactifluus subvellereus]